MYVTFPDMLSAHKWCLFAFLLSYLKQLASLAKNSSTKSEELQLLGLHQNVAQQNDGEK